MAVGEKLLDLRKKKGLSQEEVADILKVSRQTISKWETDASMPDFDKIVPLCELYDISADELLTGKRNIIEEKKNDSKEKFARNLGISIGLYIFSIVLIILFAGALNAPIIGVCLFFITIAIATGLIVYGAIIYGNKNKKKEKIVDKNVKAICDIIDILGIIIYFVVSFITMAWHLTWIIFLIIGLCESIVKLIFNLKESKEMRKDE